MVKEYRNSEKKIGVKYKKLSFIFTTKKLCTPLQTTMEYLLQINAYPENTSGEIIKKYRLLSELSQRDLAKLCNLHQSTIKDYEDNKIKDNSKTLKKIFNTINHLPVSEK